MATSDLCHAHLSTILECVSIATTHKSHNCRQTMILIQAAGHTRSLPAHRALQTIGPSVVPVPMFGKHFGKHQEKRF